MTCAHIHKTHTHTHTHTHVVCAGKRGEFIDPDPDGQFTGLCCSACGSGNHHPRHQSRTPNGLLELQVQSLWSDATYTPTHTQLHIYICVSTHPQTPISTRPTHTHTVRQCSSHSISTLVPASSTLTHTDPLTHAHTHPHAQRDSARATLSPLPFLPLRP